MKFKDWLGTFLGTAILVALMVIAVSLRAQGAVTVSPTDSPPAETVSADPMASMHGGAPANSAVFNKLVGRPAPDFTLPTYNGDNVSLKGLRGKNVILFFNEGLMCYPSCWDQVAAFAKDTQFKDDNTVVLSITVDSKDKWQEAVTKMPDLSGATVLLDTDKKVSKIYGVLTVPSSMHRGQYPGHSYVVIDRQGLVRFVNDDPQMAVRNKELKNELSKL